MSIAILEWKLRQIEQLPESFKFFAWKCMPETSNVTIYYELKGGICDHKFKSGPRKGRIKAIQDNLNAIAKSAYEAEMARLNQEIEAHREMVLSQLRVEAQL